MQIYVLNDVRMHAYYSLSALVFVLVHQCPVYHSHSANYFCFISSRLDGVLPPHEGGRGDAVNLGNRLM